MSLVTFFHSDNMLFSYTISVLIVAAGIIQETTCQPRCKGTQTYSKKANDCCLTCPQGQVSRSLCVKDVIKECATCPEPNNFIIWSQNGPKCATCRMCKKESSLVEIQSCSLLTEAICQCKSGFYCHTTLPNSCARCNPLKQCPRGHGVKQKGSHEKDTECEACPSGTYSDVISDTEACKPHTDCKKLNLVTAKRGSDTENTLCGEPIDPHLISNLNNTENTYVRHTASSTTTTLYTTTSGTFILTVKGGANEPEESNIVFFVAAIFCVISLLIAFFLAWKQRICNLKLWKNFFQPDISAVPRRTIPNMNQKIKKNLLQEENKPPEDPQKDRHEVLPERDMMNNRIEKIYIMNADTVLVGSISENSTRWRSVTPEYDSEESAPLESHYPVQESSKMSANDLMISIEEEESESCAAKALLDV